MNTRRGVLKQMRGNVRVCVCTDLHIDDGDGGLGLVEVPSDPVHRLRDVVQHQIQIHFIFLERREKNGKRTVQLGPKQEVYTSTNEVITAKGMRCGHNLCTLDYMRVLILYRCSDKLYGLKWLLYTRIQEKNQTLLLCISSLK